MNLIIQEIEEDRQREKEDSEEKEKKWMEKFSALRWQETEMAAERKLNDIWQKLKFLLFNVDLIWLLI